MVVSSSSSSSSSNNNNNNNKNNNNLSGRTKGNFIIQHLGKDDLFPD